MTAADARVLVIIPAFNEETTVGSVVRAVRGAGFDACVVDDGSNDGTSGAAAAAGAEVLRLPVNLGVGGALRCGFRYAVERGYDTVVQVDADGQHEPAAIPDLLAAMEATGADLVVGSRFAGGRRDYIVGRSRGWAMRVLARRASSATSTRLTDATSGFRAIRQPLLGVFARDYPVEYLGDTIEALVVAGGRGATVVERPVPMHRRRAGSASAGPLASAWYVVRVLTAIALMHNRRSRPPAALPNDHGVEV